MIHTEPKAVVVSGSKQDGISSSSSSSTSQTPATLLTGPAVTRETDVGHTASAGQHHYIDSAQDTFNTSLLKAETMSTNRPTYKQERDNSSYIRVETTDNIFDDFTIFADTSDTYSEYYDDGQPLPVSYLNNMITTTKYMLSKNLMSTASVVTPDSSAVRVHQVTETLDEASVFTTRGTFDITTLFGTTFLADTITTDTTKVVLTTASTASSADTLATVTAIPPTAVTNAFFTEVKKATEAAHNTITQVHATLTAAEVYDLNNPTAKSLGMATTTFTADNEEPKQIKSGNIAVANYYSDSSSSFTIAPTKQSLFAAVVLENLSADADDKDTNTNKATFASDRDRETAAYAVVYPSTVPVRESLLETTGESFTRKAEQIFDEAREVTRNQSEFKIPVLNQPKYNTSALDQSGNNDYFLVSFNSLHESGRHLVSSRTNLSIVGINDTEFVQDNTLYHTKPHDNLSQSVGSNIQSLPDYSLPDNVINVSTLEDSSITTSILLDSKKIAEVINPKENELEYKTKGLDTAPTVDSWTKHNYLTTVESVVSKLF